MRNHFNVNDHWSLCLLCRYFSYDTINEQKCETKVKKQCRTVQEEVLSSLTPFPTRSWASQTFFPNALIPRCRNLSSPTFRFARTFQLRHATQSMSRFWEHRLLRWFRINPQHIFLETLVSYLKLTWLRFHNQDRTCAENFTGLRDCLRRCLSSKLQFKSLTRKSLFLRFKDSKILDVLIQTSNIQAARPTYGRPSYGAPTPQCKRVPKQKCRNVPRQECNYVPQKVGFLFVLLVSAADA